GQGAHGGLAVPPGGGVGVGVGVGGGGGGGGIGGPLVGGGDYGRADAAVGGAGVVVVGVVVVVGAAVCVVGRGGGTDVPGPQGAPVGVVGHDGKVEEALGDGEAVVAEGPAGGRRRRQRRGVVLGGGSEGLIDVAQSEGNATAVGIDNMVEVTVGP